MTRPWWVVVAAAHIVAPGCVGSHGSSEALALDSRGLESELVPPNDAHDVGLAALADMADSPGVSADRAGGDQQVEDTLASGDAGVMFDTAGPLFDATAPWTIIAATCSGVAAPVAPTTASYEGLLPIVYGNGCSSHATLRPATSDAAPLDAHVPPEGLLGGLLEGWYFGLGGSGRIVGVSWLDGADPGVQQNCFSVWAFGDFPPWFVMLGPGPGFDYRDGHFFAADGTYCTSGVGVRWTRLQRDLQCPTSFPE